MDSAEERNNAGALLQRQGRLEEAAAHYREALRLAPGHAVVWNNLGTALQSLAQFDEAAACYARAIEIDPTYFDPHNNLGVIRDKLGRPAEAVESYAAALGLKPDFPEAWNNLGNALREVGRLEDALRAYGEAARFRPDYAAAYYNAAVALRDAGRVAEALECCRKALDLDPNHQRAHDLLLYAMQFDASIGPAEVLRQHRRWGERYFTSPFTGTPREGQGGGSVSEISNLKFRSNPHPRPPEHRGSGPERLRVGYVSPHFREHAVMSFVEPLLESHDPARCDVFCYSNTARTDGTTARLRSLVPHWRDISGMNDDQGAAQVREDRIDILVDLAGHLGGNRLALFARRPAPVQVTYLGYQTTTGLAAMQLRLTDAFADPPGMTEDLYIEELVRLPESFFCYRPEPASPPVARLPARAGHVTFGFLNHLAKLSAAMVATVSRVLQAVPNGKLLLLTHGTPAGNEFFTSLFHQHGIPGKRLEFARRGSRFDYLMLFDRVDIALDPFPFAGHTTTCDGLWQGVPAVTLAGRTFAGRTGVSVLSQLGLGECIAATADEYVRVAAELAEDVGRLASLREGMRDRMRASPMLDGPRFARHVENAYHNIFCM